MAIFGFLSGLSSRLGSFSDDELESQREELRQRYVMCQDIVEADKLFNELLRYDAEMSNRANEVYKRESSNETTRHREHGWYLPNDD